MAEQHSLEQHFAVFDLPTTATLAEVDQKYSEIINRLEGLREEHPRLWTTRTKKVDDSYLIILNRLIISTPQRISTALSHEDVVLRRYEMMPPSFQPPYARRGLKMPVFAARQGAGYRAASEEPEDLWKLEEVEGDFFDVLVRKSVIVHSVNCLGVWGAGFAKQLKDKFPRAFDQYRQHCLSTKPAEALAGTCYLIKPELSDANAIGDDARFCYVACLFTSLGYGDDVESTEQEAVERRPRYGKDTEFKIIQNTERALTGLRSSLVMAELVSEASSGSCEPPQHLFSPRINAGLFKVPWHHTRSTIERKFQGSSRRWFVVCNESGEPAKRPETSSATSTTADVMDVDPILFG